MKGNICLDRKFDLREMCSHGNARNPPKYRKVVLSSTWRINWQWFSIAMNKLVIELSGFRVDGGGRNSKSIQSKWRCWSRVHQPCQKTHADGDNALSKTIMLQIYIPKAIEQSCWMCTLGRDWSALLRMPLPPLLNHFFRAFFFVFSRSFSPFISFVHAIQLDDVRHLVVNHKVTINFSYYNFLFSAAFSIPAAVK